MYGRDAGLDGDPPDGGLVCVAIGHQLLELQSSAPDEAEGRAHGTRTIHVAFPERPQRVGVVEGDPAFLEVEAHAEPGGQRVGEAGGRGGPVVPGAVPVVAVAVLGQVDLPHAHGEEAERRSRVQVVLRAAVVAAVRVVAEDRRVPLEPPWKWCWCVGVSPRAGHVLWEMEPLLKFGFQPDSDLFGVKPELEQSALVGLSRTPPPPRRLNLSSP